MITPSEFHLIRLGRTRVQWRGHPGTIVGLPAEARELHNASLAALGSQPDGAECGEGLVVVFDDDPGRSTHMTGSELEVVGW